MKINLKLKEKFDLSEKTTVLVCETDIPLNDIINKKLNLVSGNEIKQAITIAGEISFKGKNKNTKDRAFETHDTILLSSNELRNKTWSLIGS